MRASAGRFPGRAVVFPALLALGAFACGNDPAPADAGPDAVDAGPADAGGADAGGADAGLVDAGPADAGSADAGPADAGLPPPTVVDAEVGQARTNDDTDHAQPVVPGDLVDGAIGRVVDGKADSDFYRFAAQAGDVVRLTVSARGDYRPWAKVTGADGYKRLLVAPLGAFSATRQLFLPASGDYFLEVADRRNAVDDRDVGSAQFTYRVALEAQAAAPVDVTVPVADRAGTMGAGLDVSVLRFTAGAGDGIAAEVRARRLTPPSDLDTVLYLLDATTDVPGLLAANDNIFADPLRGPDSRLRGVAAKAGAHWLVVDAIEANGPARDWRLDLAAYDVTRELEPNDTLDEANAAPTAPTAPAPMTFAGTIDRHDATGRQTGDVDHVRFEAPAGAYLELVVEPGPGAPADFPPWVQLFGPDGAALFSNPNGPLRPTVRLEAWTLAAGTHTVLVGDARNLLPLPTWFGGPSEKWELTVSVIARTVTPLGTAPVALGPEESIDRGGKAVWYSFAVPQGAPTVFSTDLDLSRGGAGDGFSLEPSLLLLGPDGRAVLASGPRLMLRDLMLAPGTYTLAISDANGAFSPDHHRLRPRVLKLGEFAGLSDDGSHATAGNALSLPTPMALVSATLAPTGETWFALGTLPAGSAVTAWTTPAAGGPPKVDTKISVVRADGSTVVGADDDSGGSYFSRLAGLALPATEAYYVRVECAWDQYVGPYLLYVRTGVCPAVPGATGQPAVNELLADPGGLDANGDGVTDAAADAFVELLNVRRDPANLADVILRVAVGPRWIGPCGLSLGPGLATPVLGGCAGAPCQSLPAANADPADLLSRTPRPERLGLDPAGDLVLVVGRDGTILDRVAYGAPTAGVSFARGQNGSCDLPAAGAELQSHPACTGATGDFSPGRPAAGGAFSSPAAPTNDTCASAVPLQPGVPLYYQDTGGMANNYDASEGSATCPYPDEVSAYNGPDAAYSITVPAGQELTVTVTPFGRWDPGIAFVTDCAAAPASCKAVVDDGWDWDPETAHWRNTGTGPVALFVLVDSFDPYSSGEFSILARLAP